MFLDGVLYELIADMFSKCSNVDSMFLEWIILYFVECSDMINHGCDTDTTIENVFGLNSTQELVHEERIV